MDDQNNEQNNLLKKVGKATINVLRPIITKIAIIALPIILIIILLAAIIYFITIDDGVYKKGDKSNVPYAVEQYEQKIKIGNDGIPYSEKSAQEVWDEIIKEGGKIEDYLDSPSQLKKLMAAETTTQFLDTRPNPDDPIDWDTLFNDVNSKKLQGIIKLKRQSEGNTAQTMTYTSPEQFEKWLEQYNDAGDESAKKNLMTHFTLDQQISANFSDTEMAEPLKEGEEITIPSGLGSVYTYERWDRQNVPNKNWSIGSNQKKFHDKYESYDAEGFGKVDGRYIIACTTTFGEVGDMIDFTIKTDSGEEIIIPTIMGDAKNQNDKGCNKWGHLNGDCIIEFMVNGSISGIPNWYNSYGDGSHVNPGNAGCHPEWKGQVIKAKNGGKYAPGKSVVNDSNKKEEENSNSNSNSGEEVEIGQAIVDYAKQFIGNPYVWGGTSLTNGCDCSGFVMSVYNHFGRELPHSSTSLRNVGIDVGTDPSKALPGDIVCYYGHVGIYVGDGKIINAIDEEHGIDYSPVNCKTILTIRRIFKQGTTTEAEQYDDIESDSELENGDGQYVAKVAILENKSTNVQTDDPNGSNLNESSYSAITATVDYQQLVKGYAMPFQYLWAMLVISEHPDFVMDLADLVFNSELEITIFDNSAEYTTQRTATYTRDVIVQNGDGTTSTKTNTYTVVTTDVTNSNTITAALTNAKTWIVDYNQEYKYKETKETQTSKQDNVTTVNTIHKKEYVEGPKTVKEKVDKDAKEPNFITVFLDRDNYKAQNNILEVSSWLFEILEENEKTKDMVDLTKYLLYKATDEDLGVKDYDFSIYEPSSFQEITSDDNVDTSNLSSSTIEVSNGNADQKLKFLFPNGLPTTSSEASKYMVTIEVPLTTRSGVKTIGHITVHKSVANDVKDVFQEAQDAGFKIYEAAGYSFRYMNNKDSEPHLSHHSYGIAIDINVNENYSRDEKGINAGRFWNPSESEFSIPKNGVLVKAFKKKGWKWGGDWSGNYQDYMHFSFTGN